MDMMEEMMDKFLGGMSKEEKQEMMGKMMDKFFAGMTVEDKQKMMAEMMPRMMMGMMGRGADEGGKAEAMSKMMGGGRESGMPMMPQMMTEMMPTCLGMMLPSMPQDKRVGFAREMLSTLLEQGSAGMSDEEKQEFRAKVLEDL